MTGILNSIRDTKVLDVTGPGCGETFEVEFNPAIDVSLYHAIRNDGTKKRGVGAIHTRSERSPKCPYCGNKFLEKMEWS